MDDRLVIVSGDSHAGAPAEIYLQYLESPYRDTAYGALLEDERLHAAYSKVSLFAHRAELTEFVDDREAIRSGRARGSFDVEVRLEEMDVEGVAAEVIYCSASTGTSPFFDVINRPHPPELRAAGARAWNRWIAEGMLAKGNGRLYGVLYPGPCLDIEETAREIYWGAERGFAVLSCPGNVYDPMMPPLYSDFWDPMWAACADTGMAVSMHAGFRFEQGAFLKVAEEWTKAMEDGPGHIDRTTVLGFKEPDEFFAEGLYAPRRAMWEMIIGGVFDRHPALIVALTEVRTDWIPEVMKHLDKRHEQGDIPSKRRPSDYWRDNLIAVASPPRPSDMKVLHEAGVNKLLYGRDYPHVEGTWPNTKEWLRAVFRGVPEADARMVLGENGLNAFKIMDRQKVSAAAAQIGFRPEEIFGDYHLDPRYLKNFDLRSGYSKPGEKVDLDETDRLLDEDLIAMAVSRAS